MNVPLSRITQANLLDLQAYSWPGNIRELQNVMERAAILSKGGKLLLNLPKSGINSVPVIPTEENNDIVLTEDEMKNRERENLLKALKQCKGKVTGADGAAELLKVRPTTLYSRIKKLKLQI